MQFSSDISPRKYAINHTGDQRSCLIVKPIWNDKLLIWGLLSICSDSLRMNEKDYRSCPDRNANGGAPHALSHPLTPHQLKLLLSLALLQHSQDVERIVEVSFAYVASPSRNILSDVLIAQIHLIRICHSTFQRLTLTLPPSYFLGRSTDRESTETIPHQRLEYTPWFQFGVEAERCIGIECLPSAIQADSAAESPPLYQLPFETRKRAASAEFAYRRTSPPPPSSALPSTATVSPNKPPGVTARTTHC